jgi:hypothetical protein
MTYQVSLDLDATDRKQIRQMALDTGMSVRGLLTKIVQNAIRDPNYKVEPDYTIHNTKITK